MVQCSHSGSIDGSYVPVWLIGIKGFVRVAIVRIGRQRKRNATGRVLKYLFQVLVLAAIAFAAYVAVSDVPAPSGEIVEEISLDALRAGEAR